MQMSTNSKRHSTDFVFPKSSCNFMQLLSGASILGCQVTFLDCQVPFPWAVRCCVVSIYRQSPCCQVLLFQAVMCLYIKLQGVYFRLSGAFYGLSGASLPGCQVSLQTVRCLFFRLFRCRVFRQERTAAHTGADRCRVFRQEHTAPLTGAVRCLFQDVRCPLSGCQVPSFRLTGALSG